MPKDPRGASRRRSGIHRAGGDGWRLMSQPCTCATPSHKSSIRPLWRQRPQGLCYLASLRLTYVSAGPVHVIGKDFMMTTVEQPTSAWIPGPILGIETSCDETAASVLAADGAVLSNIIASQHAVHQRFGGVVPELASRAHIESIEVVSAEALQKPVSHGRISLESQSPKDPAWPALCSSGSTMPKALAYALNIPLVGVSHLEGHIASAWLQDPAFPLPCVVLVVSGGHTHLYYKEPSGHCRLLGSTRDDAAGEAFDKGAQLLGTGIPRGTSHRSPGSTGKPGRHCLSPFLSQKGSLDFSLVV